MVVKLTAPAAQFTDWSKGKELETRQLWRLVLCLAGVILFLGGASYRMYQALQDRPVIVLRIGPDGRVNDGDIKVMAYTPQVEEARFYLRLWAKSYYGRVHHDFADTLSMSARFFHESISESRMRLVRDETQAFVKEEASPETEITTGDVIFSNFSEQPYQAEIHITKTVWSSSRALLGKENWVINVRFIMTGPVKEASRYNPVGVLITSIQEDRLEATRN